MKTATEIREVAKDRTDDLAGTSRKTAYAVMGAPVVAGRRIADYAGKFGKTLQKEFDAWVAEGERLSGELREAKMVSDIKERVDFDQLQGRVEKLKDQLEDVLANWRETFTPGGDKEEAATKPAAKKAAVAKKPAAKKPAAKASAKKAAAKKAAAAKKSATPKAKKAVQS